MFEKIMNLVYCMSNEQVGKIFSDSITVFLFDKNKVEMVANLPLLCDSLKMSLPHEFAALRFFLSRKKFHGPAPQFSYRRFL